MKSVHKLTDEQADSCMLSLFIMAVLSFGVACVVGAVFLSFWRTIPLAVGMTILGGLAGFFWTGWGHLRDNRKS